MQLEHDAIKYKRTAAGGRTVKERPSGTVEELPWNKLSAAKAKPPQRRLVNESEVSDPHTTHPPRGWIARLTLCALVA